MSRPGDLEELRTVLHHQSNVVARTETGVAQEMGNPVGAFIEILVGGGESRSGHDDRRSIRVLFGSGAQVELVAHRITPASDLAAIDR